MVTKAEGPDQLYSWVIAFSSCFITMLMSGLARMSGILYVELIAVYGITREEATLPFSVRSTIRNLIGPLVGILGHHFGPRKVTTAGGIIAGLGAGLCYLAPDVNWIICLWGVLHAIGFGMANTLHQVAINQYFVKYRATAFGLSYSGGCLGSFFLPLIIEEGLSRYGLRGTFLLLAGLVFHSVPLALLLRKPSWIGKDGKMKSKKSYVKKVEVSEEIIYDRYSSKEVNIISKSKYNDSFVKTEINGTYSSARPSIDFSFKNAGNNRNNSLPISTKIDSKTLERNIINANINHGSEEVFLDNQMFVTSKIGPLDNSSNEIDHYINQELSNQDADKSYTNPCFMSDESLIPNESAIDQNVKDLDNSQSHPNPPLVIEENSTPCEITNDTVSQSEINPENMKFEKLKISKTNSVNKNTNFVFVHLSSFAKIALNPMFELISFTLCAYCFVFIPLMTVIVDYVMDKGVDQANGKYVIAAFSLGDIVGRMCLGWTMDKGYISKKNFTGVNMTVMGALLLLYPIVHNFTAVMGLSAVFGIAEGCVCIMFPILIHHYTPQEYQSHAMGSISFLSGITGFGIAPMIGHFRDRVGSYDGMFFIMGSLSVVLGLLWFFEPFIKKFQKHSRRLTH